MSGQVSERRGVPVLLVGFAPEEASRLERLLDGFRVRVARRAEIPLGDPAPLVVTGPELDAAAAAELVRGATVEGAPPPKVLVLAAGDDLGPLEPLLATDRVYFVSRRPPEPHDTAALVRAAARVEPPMDAEAAGEVLALERDLAAASRREEVAERLVAALPRMVPEVSEARCLLHDRASATLSEPAASGVERHSTAAGLLAWVARTGRPVAVARPADDPRHDPELDGTGDAGLGGRALTGSGGEVLAVLAVRWREPLSARGERRLAALAGRAAAALDRLALVGRFAESTRGTSMFRPAALEAQARGSDDDGGLLELGSGWVRHTYRMLLLLLVAAALYLTFATHTEYVSGPAVIEVDGRSEVRSPFDGTVVRVEVVEGDRVAEGDPLVRFYGAGELAEVESLERQLRTAMVERLRSGDDPATGASLADLRSRWQLARASLEQRTLRAAVAGEVRELRVEGQQVVTSGDVLVVLGRAAGRPRVLAFLPGSARPQLSEGMEVRLRLDGYPQVVQELRLTGLSDSVVGPREADRLLPADLTGALRLDGASLPVEAILAGSTFESGGQRYVVYGGMTGTLEAAVRRQRLIVTLVPGLGSFADGDAGGER